MLYLKSPDSKAMRDRIAAASPGVLILYVEKADAKKGAACEAVSHSSRKGAPEQVPEFGAIVRSISADTSRPLPEVGGVDGLGRAAEEDG